MESVMASSEDLYRKLKEKLNLGERVIDVSISLKVDHAATITVTRMISSDEAGVIADAISGYELYATPKHNP